MSEKEVKITYYGHAMFEIQSSDGIRIITDPYNEAIKDNLPDVTAEIVTVSHDHFDHNNVSLVKGNPVIVKGLGQSKVKDISFEGILSYHDQKKGSLRGENTIFKFIVDNIIFVHLGDLGHNLDEETIKKLSILDILMIPVGGTYTINFLEAYNLATRLKPKVLIPMHYKEKDSKLDVDSVDSFLSRWNNFEKKPQSILISKRELDSMSWINVWVLESK